MRNVICFILFFSSALVFAADMSPQDTVKDIFARAADPLVATDLAKQAEISKQVDFGSLAKGALGDEAKKLSTKELAWFGDTLMKIITLTVYPKAPDFLKDVKIEYGSDAQTDELFQVHSTVQNKSDLTDVVYFLKKESGQGWRVVDISLSGNQWTSVIHDEVMDVLRKKKWKGLKEAMEKRLHTLQQKT